MRINIPVTYTSLHDQRNIDCKQFYIELTEHVIIYKHEMQADFRDNEKDEEVWESRYSNVECQYLGSNIGGVSIRWEDRNEAYTLYVEMCGMDDLWLFFTDQKEAKRVRDIIMDYRIMSWGAFVDKYFIH